MKAWRMAFSDNWTSNCSMSYLEEVGAHGVYVIYGASVISGAIVGCVAWRYRYEDGAEVRVLPVRACEVERAIGDSVQCYSRGVGALQQVWV